MSMTAAELYGVSAAPTAELAVSGAAEPATASAAVSPPPSVRSAGLAHSPALWLVAIIALAIGIITVSVHVGVK